MDVPPLSAARLPALRLRTSFSNALLTFLGLIAGPATIAGLVADGEHPAFAAVGIGFILYGLYSLGSVTVVDGTIERRAFFRTVSIQGHEVREIGLGMRRAGTTKYWLPVIETTDGESIVLNNLMSTSKKRSQNRISMIREAATRKPATPAEAFAGTNFVSKQDEPEPEPTPLLSGYQQYLAEREAQLAAAVPVALAAVPAPNGRAPIVVSYTPPPMPQMGITSRAA